MKIQLAFLCAALSCSFLAVCAPAGATGGLAWDSVTKFSMSQTAPQPGDFATDFKPAAQPPPATPDHGGMFGLGGMMAKAQAMGAMFANGMAQRHYAAGNLLRVDDPGSQTATITDCRARTLTTLNYADKTYRVESLDALDHGPSHAPSAPSGPAPQTPQDNTKMNIVVTTSALGSKEFSGTSADGYQADMKITVIPESGDPKTMDMLMTSYFSGTAEPTQSCYHAMEPGAMGRAAMNMGLMQHVMAAMRTPKGDPRFTISASGPALPIGRLSLFTVFAPQSSKGGFTILTENGNVRPISDSDASVFAVPAGFTKVN
jgi:hypothetical protein